MGRCRDFFGDQLTGSLPRTKNRSYPFAISWRNGEIQSGLELPEAGLKGVHFEKNVTRVFRRAVAKPVTAVSNLFFFFTFLPFLLTSQVKGYSNYHGEI